ncbi:molybdopterin biosynthesis protein [Fictibacillus macauensis ZFHKF-1]|uniref:Molybdopterin molybdenumtransferase n=1 Tax=Fictibacillus macauensis ZFHKF-1 TaxID=1196324 RepID=I8AG17_9BACL|nr:gephyrin-like molybdotransferase Glp [Fictibacillus macauensis]EIT84572.1 molybdopterin biosynthesis protein [Fictibacillus macauensis ZFHKF-1]
MSVQKRQIMQVDEAITKLLEVPLHGTVEIISLEDSDGRYLAEDLIAPHAVPPFDRSPYDGFALASQDTKTASHKEPVMFQVIDHIGAGAVSQRVISEKEAIRIMTGAQLPRGADAVVMLEVVKEHGVDAFELSRQINKGENVSYKGEDTKKGEIILTKGTRIHPGVIALLATFGYSEIPVFKRPLVGILATGTELLDIREPLQPGKIRNSNAYMIAAQLRKLGAHPVMLGTLSDDYDHTFLGIQNALKTVDLLITTGGVSVGDFDHLPRVYEELGATLLFNKIAMRPGSVTSAARFQDKMLFGLSGNPSACFVGCELFVRPYIVSSFHARKPHLTMMKATLGADFLKANPFTRFVRGTVTMNDSDIQAVPAGLDKSGSVSSLALANAFIVLRGGTRGWKKGDAVYVLLLDGEGSEWPWTVLLSK